MDTLPSSIPNTVRHQAIYNFFFEREAKKIFLRIRGRLFSVERSEENRGNCSSRVSKRPSIPLDSERQQPGGTGGGEKPEKWKLRKGES